jgi:hypothetical protein
LPGVIVTVGSFGDPGDRPLANRTHFERSSRPVPREIMANLVP